MNILPKCSIILVNWNGAHYLRDCFRSLKKQTMEDFELVFVDNASTDESVTVAKQLAVDLCLNAKFVVVSSNRGFTGGNIEGLKHCSGEYIALLNNDTIVTERWLDLLVDAMDSRPDVGICASKLIVAGTEIIDSAGDILTTSMRVAKRGEGMPANSYNVPEYVFGACAGAVLYRKRMIDEIGFFDDDFFVLFEDADLNFRAQLSGWKCFYVPGAVVYHKVGATLGRLGEMAAFYGVRNDKIMTFKNVPASVFLRHIPSYLWTEAVSIAYHMRIGRFRSYLKGNCAFFGDINYHLRKRKKVMALRKVGAGYMNGLLTGIGSLHYKKYSSTIKYKIRSYFGSDVRNE